MIKGFLNVEFVGVGEKKINQLKRRSRRFWVECPYYDGVENVEHGKDYVGLVSDVLQSWRRDLNDEKIADEIRSCC